MKVEFINSSYRRWFHDHEVEIMGAIKTCLSSGKLILQDDVERFEKALAEVAGKEYAVALNSGTDALFLALKAYGVGKGDEVITVSHTFLATIEAIVHNGARPVLVDVDENGLIDLSHAKWMIGENTKAIIPVHLTGDVAPPIVPENIIVIEDAAQAIGAEGVGFGDLQCYSFYPAKILGACGDAGAITTNDKEMADEIRLLRNHYSVKNPEGDLKWGFNSRMDNLQAAVLNTKIKYLPYILEKRQAVAEKYNEAFKDLPIALPPNTTGRVWQDYIIRAEDRDKLKEYLDENGVETLGANLIPNHKQPGLGLDQYALPNTERIYEEQLRLPCNENLLPEEVDYVIEQVRSFYV